MKSLIPVFILGFVLLALVLTARCTQKKMHEYETRNSPEESENAGANALAERHLMEERFPDTIARRDGIRFRILKDGEGEKPIAGSQVRAHYEGRLLDVTVFDSSYSRGEPYEFTLLAGKVIRGWDESVIDKRKGEKRLIIVPSDLAYGERGRPPIIPPRAPLVFEIELVDFD
jgi:FKBP-type peptidyl-prolyl cis-trans isomerase